MSVKISYLNKLKSKTVSNVVLFVNENFNIINVKKFISIGEFSYISDLLKSSD